MESSFNSNSNNATSSSNGKSGANTDEPLTIYDTYDGTFDQFTVFRDNSNSNNNNNTNSSSNNTDGAAQQPQQQQQFINGAKPAMSNLHSPSSSSSSQPSSPLDSHINTNNNISTNGYIKQIGLYGGSIMGESSDVPDILKSKPSKEKKSKDKTSSLEIEEKVDKQKARRTNQNMASRNYRQRKKVYIKEMEEKINQLTLENDTLKKDLSKIGQNPTELFRLPQEMVYLMTQIRNIVIQLDQALRKGEGDAVLKDILNGWHMNMEQASALNEKEIERFVHPYTQIKLTLMGYKPFSNPWTDFVKMTSHIQWWGRYTDKAELTVEQSEQITSLWEKYSEEESTLRKEMAELDEKIKKFYLSKVIILPSSDKLNVLSQSNIPIDETPDPDENEMSYVLEFTYNLERMKQKFIKMGRLIWDTSKQMGKYLTIRQEAILLVLVHSNTKYVHSNMEMANNLWNQLNQSQFSKLNLSIQNHFDQQNQYKQQQQQQQQQQQMYSQTHATPPFSRMSLNSPVLVHQNATPPQSVYGATNNTNNPSNNTTSNSTGAKFYSNSNSPPPQQQPQTFLSYQNYSNISVNSQYPSFRLGESIGGLNSNTTNSNNTNFVPTFLDNSSPIGDAALYQSPLFTSTPYIITSGQPMSSPSNIATTSAPNPNANTTTTSTNNTNNSNSNNSNNNSTTTSNNREYNEYQFHYYNPA